MRDGRDKQNTRETKPGETGVSRKPYSAPRLRYLGSVRELTQGTGTHTNDGLGAQLQTG